MTTHDLDNLDQSNGTLNGWVATCSCHNPDGDGEGRADFRGVTALEAVQLWLEHHEGRELPGPTRRVMPKRTPYEIAHKLVQEFAGPILDPYQDSDVLKVTAQELRGLLIEAAAQSAAEAGEEAS